MFFILTENFRSDHYPERVRHGSAGIHDSLSAEIMCTFHIAYVLLSSGWFLSLAHKALALRSLILLCIPRSLQVGWPWFFLLFSHFSSRWEYAKMCTEEDRHSSNVAKINPSHVYGNLARTAWNMNNEVAAHSVIPWMWTGHTRCQTPFQMLGIRQKMKEKLYPSEKILTNKKNIMWQYNEEKNKVRWEE